MDYTTVDLVRLYGDLQELRDSVAIGKLITGYSDQVDRVVNQVYGVGSYDGVVCAGRVNRDGVLMVYPPVPVLQVPVEFAWQKVGRSAWVGVDSGRLEVEARWAGAVVRVLDDDFGGVRNLAVRARMSFSGGYGFDELPAGFELAARQLVWWGLKLREAPIHKTAVPGLGELVVPADRWPGYVRQAFGPYVRRTV